VAESYGLPAGSAIDYGAPGFPRWVDDLCLRWGLNSSTYPGHQEGDRPDIGSAPNPNHLNRGIDWAGPADKMLAYAHWCVSVGPPRTSGVYGPPGLEMVIYEHAPTGERVWYPSWVNYESDFGGHRDHVHTRQSADFSGAPAPPPSTPELSKQDTYALAVIREGQKRGISPRGIQIALTVPFVESGWQMYANSNVDGSEDLPHDRVGSDHDSTGLFQQRQAWGPLSCTMDAACSAGLFYDGGAAGQRGLTDFDYNDPSRTPGQVAQSVQVSAFPDRYQQHWDEAVALYNRLAAGPPTSPDDGGALMALTEQQQADLYKWIGELHGALFNQVTSESAFRHLGEGPRWQLHQLIEHIDGFNHPEYVEWSAAHGHAGNLALLREVAGGDPRVYPDRVDDIALAKSVLARVLTSTPVTGPTPTPGPSPSSPVQVPHPPRPAPGPPATPSPQKITLLTAQGHLADMWTGYPADLARAMDPTLFYHQPIGNWDAGALPLGPACDAGYREGVNLLTVMHPTGPFALCGYSQGAIITSRLYQALAGGGELAHRRNDFVGGVTFGNPMREQGHFVGKDPGGHGIASHRLSGTGQLWRDYADPDDIYTSVEGPSGDDMTAVYDLIMYVDPINFMAEVLKLFTNPASQLMAAAQAIFQFMQFGTTTPATAAHVSYEWREVWPGVTYFADACSYMTSVGDRVRR